MFEQTSKYANSVDGAMFYITAISVAMLLLITIAMIFFVVKYRAKKNPIPTQYHGNAAIEALWITIPTVLVITMFFWGYNNYSDMSNTQKHDEEYSVTAKMWDWDFQYSNGLVTDTLYVPVNKTLKFNITSLDVLHSFYIPAFRIKKDAVPSRTVTYYITPEKTGVFDIACAEYCGQKHWDMYKKFVVMPEDEYYAWIDSQEGTVEKMEADVTNEDNEENSENEQKTDSEVVSENSSK